MIIKERYKLTEYFGYRFLPRGDTLIELFDIDNDYQEMNDLYETHPEIVNQLRRELNQRIQITDEPFQE